MDAFFNIVSDIWQIIVTQVNIFLAPVPNEIICFGIIAGFLCSIPEKQPYTFREINKTLFEIKRSSSVLASITIFAVAGYIFYISGPWHLFYLICSLLLGSLIYMLIFFLLNKVEIIGSFFNSMFTIFSGPALIFLAWFFYTGELMQVLTNLLRKIPF